MGHTNLPTCFAVLTSFTASVKLSTDSAPLLVVLVSLTYAGNELISLLTYGLSNDRAKRQVLRVELEDWEGNSAYALYDDFRVLGEDEDYKLASVGKYSGTAGRYDNENGDIIDQSVNK